MGCYSAEGGLWIRISDFGFPSAFGSRISDLEWGARATYGAVLATTAFILARPVFATPNASSDQYFRLNSSSESTFWPPVRRKTCNYSGSAAIPSPGYTR